jgi:glycosyltransferase involved in cell wall biosynthesis
MRISAVIDNYNYAQYICEAIDSVLNQTYRAFEIIVVDDGSNDQSVALIKEKYGTEIIIIESENKGQLHALKLGIERARGEFIAFLDADDFWQPDHLEKAYRLHQRHNEVSFIIGNCQVIGARNGPWHPLTSPIDYGVTTLAAFTQEWIGAPTCALIIKRNYLLFMSALPEDIFSQWPTRADDVLIYGGSIFGAYKYRLTETTAYWRIHQSNNSHKIKKDRLNNEIYNKKRQLLIDTLIRLRYGGDADPLTIIANELKNNKLRKVRNKRNLIKKIIQTSGPLLQRFWLIIKICFAR